MRQPRYAWHLYQNYEERVPHVQLELLDLKDTEVTIPCISLHEDPEAVFLDNANIIDISPKTYTRLKTT